MSKILIIEDEESIAELEKDYLELSGFTVEIENNGEEGLTRALEEKFDLLILDLMLPGVDGFEICKRVRKVKNTPILMVSAKKEDIDKIRGLGLGADDYITKPFSLMVLRARINTQMRKMRRGGLQVYQAGKFYFSFSSMEFIKGNQRIELSKTEQKLLKLLVENRGLTLSRGELVDRIWTDGAQYVDENALSVTIKRLRDKLEDNSSAPRYIKTVYGIGYTWSDERIGGMQRGTHG